MTAPSRPWRRDLGARSRRAGRLAETIAATWLLFKGYQILGFRLKAGPGDIDILARRGRTLVLVEVKRRETPEAALDSLAPDQRVRLLRAGQALLQKRKSLAGFELRLDLMAFSPGRLPRHFRGLIVDTAT
jgi:putative endonuclease